MIDGIEKDIKRLLKDEPEEMEKLLKKIEDNKLEFIKEEINKIIKEINEK